MTIPEQLEEIKKAVDSKANIYEIILVLVLWEPVRMLAKHLLN